MISPTFVFIVGLVCSAMAFSFIYFSVTELRRLGRESDERYGGSRISGRAPADLII